VLNFKHVGHHAYMTDDRSYTNALDFGNQLKALAQVNNGQFSCLDRLLEASLWEYAMRTATTYGYGADDYLYRAINSKWGYVNPYVASEINKYFPLLRPPNTDMSQNKIKCSYWNGGDRQRIDNNHQDPTTYAHNHNDMCGVGTVYLRRSADGWCEAFDPSTDPALRSCGEASLEYSEATPISLLWSPQLTLEKFASDIRLVKFALDLNDGSDSFYEWKASGEAPLLVYDPDHTGVVKSASQLFGSWSFGGKGGSKLDSKREPWNDGYEALETQDADADGKINGAELDSISLWFDHNRDAVSQPGEVVSATKAGLVELYYRDASEKQADGSRHLNVGFRRKDGAGLLSSGASIDWTARAAEVGQTLFEGDLMRPGKPGSSSTIQTASQSSSPQQAQPSQAVASEIGGYWRWVNGIADRPSNGILFLRANQDGSVEGSTVSETVMGNAAKGDKFHAIRFVTLQGKLDPQDKSKVAFSMVLPDNDQSARSTAALIQQNGKTYLKGTTEASIVTPEGTKRTISYDWLAERLTKPQPR
jgi:hypothetical protein